MEVNKQLVEAVRQNNIQEVQRLIAEGADVKFNHDLALKTALSAGFDDIAKFLIESGALEGDLTFSPLEYPIGRNNLEMLKYLFESGVRDPDALSQAFQDYYYPLDEYGSRGFRHRTPDMKIIKYLLDQGVDVNESHISEPALQIAAQNLNVEHVKLLLQYGADPNLPDYYGYTALMSVSNKTCTVMNYQKYKKYPKAIEIAKILLDAGADPNIVAQDNNTALTNSVIAPEPYEDPDGYPEHATCFRLDMAKLLVDHGAIDYGNRVFDYSIEEYHPYILYLVSKNDQEKLQRAIQIIVGRDLQNRVAIDAAVVGDLEALRFAKDVLNIRFESILTGTSKRKIAVRNKKDDILLEKLVLYFSGRDGTRNTLLSLSAYNDNLEVTRYIYETVRDELGGDLNALMKYFIRENVYGKIAISIAFEWCNKDVFIYLYNMLKEFSQAIVEYVIYEKLLRVEGCPDLNVIKAEFISGL